MCEDIKQIIIFKIIRITFFLVALVWRNLVAKNCSIRACRGSIRRFEFGLELGTNRASKSILTRIFFFNPNGRGKVSRAEKRNRVVEKRRVFADFAKATKGAQFGLCSGRCFLGKGNGRENFGFSAFQRVFVCVLLLLLLCVGVSD